MGGASLVWCRPRPCAGAGGFDGSDVEGRPGGSSHLRSPDNLRAMARRWEYRTVTLFNRAPDSNPDGDRRWCVFYKDQYVAASIDGLLDDHGQHGWELVSTTTLNQGEWHNPAPGVEESLHGNPTGYAFATSLLLIFKRPVED